MFPSPAPVGRLWNGFRGARPRLSTAGGGASGGEAAGPGPPPPQPLPSPCKGVRVAVSSSLPPPRAAPIWAPASASLGGAGLEGSPHFGKRAPPGSKASQSCSGLRRVGSPFTCGPRATGAGRLPLSPGSPWGQPPGGSVSSGLRVRAGPPPALLALDREHHLSHPRGPWVWFGFALGPPDSGPRPAPPPEALARGRPGGLYGVRNHFLKRKVFKGFAFLSASPLRFSPESWPPTTGGGSQPGPAPASRSPPCQTGQLGGDRPAGAASPQ